MKNWEFFRSVIDGEELRLQGLNIWDFPWKATGESISVKDPIYQQSHVFSVYEITDGPVSVHFATGEFSNLVWGIYLPVQH